MTPEELSGWGRSAHKQSQVRRPAADGDLVDTVVTEPKITVRGAGKSYGDAALPGQGIVVLLSSAAAVRPRESIAAYSLGKQLADSTAVLLARQTADTGVRVLVVRPGFVATCMTADLPKPPLATTPGRVAKRVAAAVRSGKTIVWVPRRMSLAVHILNLAPRRILPKDWR